MKYVCLDSRCKNHNIVLEKTLQQSCRWARILGGAFCIWCGGDLKKVKETT